MVPFRHVLACVITCASMATMAGELPSAQAFPSVDQQKSLSVQHWQSIAVDLADTLTMTLGPSLARGLYVAAPDEGSVFDKQLKVFLVDVLHSAGIRMYAEPAAGVLEIRLGSSVTSHKGPADRLPALAATGITAGALLVTEALMTSFANGIMTAALATDTARAIVHTPNRSEIAVTVTVVDRGEYLSHNSKVYYVSKDDLRVYTGSTARKTVTVTDKQ